VGKPSVILADFVAVTGYERKYAIRLLLGPIRVDGAALRGKHGHGSRSLSGQATARGV
jgi:hypothetical protein